MITSVQSNKDFGKDTKCADIKNYITSAVQSTKKNTLIKASGTESGSLEVLNSCLDDVLAVYNELTGGNYLFIVQGVEQNGFKVEKKSKMVVLQDDPTPEPEPEPTPTPTPTQPIHTKYIGPQTLVAIFVVLVLGWYLIFSVNHLMAIEGPLRFPVASQLPATTREY